MIPFTEFSKDGDLFHFAHANGYPVGCYHTFLKPFIEQFSVIGMHARPMWEGIESKNFSSWNKFAQDFQHFCTENGLKKMIGMGHSMGAISSLIAAHENPQLFSKLILLDPVIPPPFYHRISFLPFFIAKRINPMVKVALRRRNQWESRTDAEEYFKSKKIYSRFDKHSFMDFIDHGLVTKEGQLHLAYPRELEAKVYSTLPAVWHILKNPPCPLVIVRGQYSNVITDKVWALIQKSTQNAQFIEMPNVGHMMPMEKPEELSKIIHRYL